jgi:hypothetical protein
MNAQVFIGRTIASSIFAASLVLSTGCMEPAQRHDEFESDMQETLSVDEVLERQAMAGAAADATLNSSHFEGSALNELGRTKLNAIIQRNNGPATVYVDVADTAPARVTSVTQYLKDAGASSQNFKVEAGPNPKTTVAAVEGLKRMQKTESSEKDERNERIIGVGVSNGSGSMTEINK